MTVDSRLFPAKAAPVTIPTMSTPANATGELHVDNLGVTTTEDVGCATTAATTRSFGFKLGGPRITILSPGNVVVKSMSGFSCSRVAQSNPLCSTNHRTFSPCLNVYHSLPSCTLVPSSASLPESPRHVVSPSATEASTRPPRVDSLASSSRSLARRLKFQIQHARRRLVVSCRSRAHLVVRLSRARQEACPHRAPTHTVAPRATMVAASSAARRRLSRHAGRSNFALFALDQQWCCAANRRANHTVRETPARERRGKIARARYAGHSLVRTPLAVVER